MAVLGLRRKPGLIALTVFRTMPLAYRMHLGRLFGHTFLNLPHRERRSGRLYTTALKTVAWDRATGEVVVFSMYGMNAARRRPSTDLLTRERQWDILVCHGRRDAR